MEPISSHQFSFSGRTKTIGRLIILSLIDWLAGPSLTDYGNSNIKSGGRDTDLHMTHGNWQSSSVRMGRWQPFRSITALLAVNLRLFLQFLFSLCVAFPCNPFRCHGPLVSAGRGRVVAPGHQAGLRLLTGRGLGLPVLALVALHRDRSRGNGTGLTRLG